MNTYFTPESQWFWHPARKAGEAGYTLFRRKIHCAEAMNLNIAVSADNRYNLYLDGQPIGCGPCRSNLEHYVFEEYEFPLEPGDHMLAIEVVVWSGGWRSSAAAWSEIHAGGGLLVCGSVGEERFDDFEKWLCCIDSGRRPLEWHESWNAAVTTPVPPMDRVDFRHFTHRWTELDFDDSAWQKPAAIGQICLAGETRYDPATPWQLMPRQTGPMKITLTPIRQNIKSGVIPAGKHRFVIDIGRNQTSMIHFCGRGGGGEIRLAYSEEENPPGYADILIPAPGEWQYHSFWFRSGRYIEVICTLSEPMEIISFEAEFITYDFKRWAEFHAPEHPTLEKIWHVAVHTARCCIHEHYEDCPYYEQLQYAGDTRVQALISYAATGDGVPGRLALRHFDWSRLPCGLTQSRYPNQFTQVIPEFSLIWILMIYDYYSYFGEPEVISEHLNGINSVLNYFEELRGARGLIECVGYWNFTDWAKDWPGGRSDRGSDEPETIVNLFYAEACRAAQFMCGRLLLPDRAAELAEKRRITLDAVNRFCFDDKRGLYRDMPGRNHYSVHANALALLADAVPLNHVPAIAAALTDNPALCQATLYFNFYVLEALKKCGDGARFMKMLDPWIAVLNQGHTTFPECPEPHSRSKCHAWSASPVYEFITGLLGISPAIPGFGEINVAPLTVPGLKLSARIPVGTANMLEVAIDGECLTLHPDKPTGIHLCRANGESEFQILNSRQVFQLNPTGC